MSGLQLGALGVGGGLVVLVLWAAWVSWREGEEWAYRVLLALGFLGALPTLYAGFGDGPAAAWTGVIILVVTGLGGGLVLLPIPGRSRSLGDPVGGVDERDIMFSRAALEPGTDRFHTYYRGRPEKRAADDLFRMEAGLLKPGSSHYHPAGFAAAEAAFWTIEMLRPYVDGGAGSGGVGLGDGGGRRPWGGEAMGAAVGRSGSEDPQAVPPRGWEIRDPGSTPPDPAAMTRFLKVWGEKLGAHSVGVTELRDYHLYTHVGRGEDWGQEVRLPHTHALALTVEMDKEMVDRAPRSPTVMESARQYLRSGVLAIQLADMIRRMGFGARAHVDGNYRVICPLVARDAGLGELGRMGLLMTPRLGPRVRIAVVTTDLPLAVDEPFCSPSVIDFCTRCRKCAECCPSQALSFDDPEPDENGVLRWKIDDEACFTLWAKLGTDCARCMAVCPYSHPDNLLHNLIREGIRRNALFRRGAVVLDDLVYGRRPPPRELQPWLGELESQSPPFRT